MKLLSTRQHVTSMSSTAVDLHDVIAALQTLDAKEDDDVAKGLAAAVSLEHTPLRERQHVLRQMCPTWDVRRKQKDGATWQDRSLETIANLEN